MEEVGSRQSTLAIGHVGTMPTARRPLQTFLTKVSCVCSFVVSKAISAHPEDEELLLFQLFVLRFIFADARQVPHLAFQLGFISKNLLQSIVKLPMP